jgi:hypothetical protein
VQVKKCVIELNSVYAPSKTCYQSELCQVTGLLGFDYNYPQVTACGHLNVGAIAFKLVDASAAVIS